jgi:hypothetical protein
MDTPTLRTLTNYHSPTVYTKVLHDESIVFATQHRHIIFYNPKTTEQKILQLDRHAYFEKNRVSITTKGNHIAYVHNDKKTLHIIDTQKNKVIHSFNAYGQEIDIIAFDTTSHYLIVGTSKGRVLEYSLTSKSFVDRLTSFPEHTTSEMIGFKTNYVSAFAFSSEHLLSSGYGGSVVLTNLDTHTNDKRFHNGRSRIDALTFIDSTYFLEGNEQSTLKKISIKEHRLIKQIPLSIGSIQQIVLLKRLPFALITSHFNTISLVNYETMALIKKEFITTPQMITTITCTSKYELYVTQFNGEVLHVNLLPLDEFKALIKNNSVKYAYALCDSNILLRYTKNYKKLEALFSHHYANALKFLIHHKVQEAKDELEDFKHSKQDDCKTLFTHFKHYEKMVTLFKEKKYAAIYGLTSQYSLLKATPVFKRLQKLWYEKFYDAYAILDTGNEINAKKTIYDFFAVPQKRPLITLLFSQPDIINSFYTTQQQNDTQTLNGLLQNHPELAELTTPLSSTNSYDDDVQEFKKVLKIYDFEGAKKILDAIRKVPHLHTYVSELEQRFKSVKKFFYFYEKHKYFNCYQLIDSRPELAFLNEPATLQKRWNLIIYRCEKATMTGNIKTIKKELGSLLELKSRSSKIGAILRVAYRHQIAVKIKKNETKAFHNGITNYLNFFGNDDELDYLITQVKKSSFSLPFMKQKPIRKERISWLKSSFKLPNNITDGIIT